MSTREKDRIIEIETEHAYDLKSLFEVLKDVLHETPIEITRGSKQNNKKEESESEDESDDDSDESDSDSDKKKKAVKKAVKKKPSPKTKKKTNSKNDGMIKILTLNENKTLIVSVKLEASNFTNFYAKYDTYDIGIDLNHLHNFMRSVDKDGTLTILIREDDKQKIVFKIENKERKSDDEFKLKLMDINKKQYKIPEQEFDMKVTMKTEDFHKMCRDMSTIGIYMAITCTDKKIEFSCKGSVSERTKTFRNGTGATIRVVDKSEDKKLKDKKLNIIKEIYDLRNLTLFNKCSNLCENIEILLRNKNPLFIIYRVATLGEMKVGFVPVDESLLNKNSNYNDQEDKYYEDGQDDIKIKE
uniref:Proliferating cell nuclear antigen PCNA N-terminal domain-containing protein n=1 Tax=viral metagenome TaxID=1070528 RepID=A0A6C0ED30_9ZZZZ